MKGSGEPSTGQQSGSEAPKHKCCLGMLYYSQAIHDRGKNPVCAGVRSRHLTSSELAEMRPESIPAGEFKYTCLGYSMHVDRQKQKQQAFPVEDQDSIELPYCEGIQVVVATEAQRSPMLQSDANQAAAPQQSQPERRPPRKTYGGSQDPGGIELGEVSERFFKTSGKIVNKMGSNLNQLASTAKEVADKLSEQIWRKRD